MLPWESRLVAVRVASDVDLRAHAVDWIIANFAAIKAKAPPIYIDYTITFATGGDHAVYEKLRDFLRDPSRLTPFAEKNIVKTGERVGLLTRLREKEQASVEAYLAKYPATAPRATN